MTSVFLESCLSRVQISWKWNWCPEREFALGCAVEWLWLCWSWPADGTGDIQGAAKSTVVPLQESKTSHQMLSPLWHAGSLALTAWPWFFSTPLCCLDLVLYLLLILEKGGWRPRDWRWFHCLRPYLPTLLLLLLHPLVVFLISALPPQSPQFALFPLWEGWHERKHPWAQSSHLLPSKGAKMGKSNPRAVLETDLEAGDREAQALS